MRWPCILTPHRQLCKGRLWREFEPKLLEASRCLVHCKAAAEKHRNCSKCLFSYFKPEVAPLWEVGYKQGQQLMLRGERISKIGQPGRTRWWNSKSIIHLFCWKDQQLNIELLKSHLPCPWHPHYRIFTSFEISLQNLRKKLSTSNQSLETITWAFCSLNLSVAAR